MGRPVQEAAAHEAQAAAAVHTDSANSTIPHTFINEIDITNQDLAEDDVPLPAYGEIYGEIRDEKDGTGTSASVTDDGRVNIRINHLNRRLSQIFIPALDQHIQDAQASCPPGPAFIPSSLGSTGGVLPPPRMNIVIQVVGSRGDVQPFVALGKLLKKTYGHRVRLATHPTFKGFVLENGLEFFSIGGDPTRLMAFMVKNPGLRPGFRSVANGDVGQRRKDVAEYIQGCWRSCYQASDGVDDTHHEPGRGIRDTEHAAGHFVADCIIANPPSFAHIHCAEKLGIPLHIMFTMPYSPTQVFPHPLANIQSSNADPQLTNYISYAMIEILSWQVLGDIINRFRAKCLGLDPVSRIWGPGMLQRLKIPHTYCWSSALIPKPADWGSHISISGFYFLDLASDYSPDPDLLAFLNSGPPPVYIGFGSIVLDDPDAMTDLIFRAAKKTGQRILLSKGWGGIGADELHVPDGIFMLGNVPHDWLFKQVSCVVHHGGAGTTAAGITAGKPTVVVPFFGDQPFWGAMVARAGAGPDPIPQKRLTADNLADAINFCLRPESLERAQELASRIAAEQGCHTGAQSFHQHLEPDRLRCTLVPSRASVWRIKRTKVRLSAFAACTLANANLLAFEDLKLFRPQEHYIDEGPWDPISGGFTAFLGAVGGMMMGLAGVPSETWKAVQIPAERSRQHSQTSLSKAATRSEALHVGNGSNSLTSFGQSGTILTMEDSLARVQSPTNPSGRSAPTSAVSRSSGSGPSQGLTSSEKDNDSLRRSRSRNESRPSKDYDMLRPTGVHMSKGAGRFVKAVVQGPVDISVNLTRGMHNVPKLWGDDTVRPQERVTDLRSGVKAVGREFGFGFYDGITGLVTQPWKGAKENGASGFVKGVGKGMGGFLAKPGAACLGILSHTMQGFNKEVQKLFGSDVQSYINASRAAQGYEEWLRSSDEEKQDVIMRWKRIQKDLKGKGKAGNMSQEAQEDQQKTDLQAAKNPHNAKDTASSSQSASSADIEVQDLSGIMLPNDDTSSLRTGNLAPAMASMAGVLTSRDHQEDADLRLAIDESLAMQTTSAVEAQRCANGYETNSNLDLYHADEAEYDREYERERMEFEAISERAAALTNRSPDYQQPPAYDSGHLAGTSRSDFEAEEKGQIRREKTAEEKTEEEIVMEYIKKQSLLEVHHQNRGKGGGSAFADADDEDLQKALKLSMQEHVDRYGDASGT
uniref:Glycosyltransferase n=1 Tax=Phoma sp. TaxID=1707701 RepID=A0A4D6I9H5_PHOSX|nr:glycosyltransferase [Phoma sp.]